MKKLNGPDSAADFAVVDCIIQPVMELIRLPRRERSHGLLFMEAYDAYRKESHSIQVRMKI